MSGESKQYGANAKTEDVDTTPPAKRGQPAGPQRATTAGSTAVMEPPQRPAPLAPGDVMKRGGSGGFVPSSTAKGADLVRDIAGPQEQATRTFWLGTLPSCPRAVVHLFGQDFPDYCDPEVKLIGGQTRRAYQLGVLRNLTPARVAGIKEALSRRFIRWTGDGKGEIYCIPTPADIELMRAAKRPVEYPQPGDDWLARHVYMVETRHRGDTYPPSAYETGIE